jgi:hypothetical protein
MEEEISGRCDHGEKRKHSREISFLCFLLQILWTPKSSHPIEALREKREVRTF